ncbi:MAG: acetyl-CoA carboxylase biotin carboxylase subunit [Candidatus Dadabacteria bacterium]|nr:MAG: acetyl-CoA carboxylase biotin carboxylase subunit [Candidatus Dadabacteria bacterium]
MKPLFKKVLIANRGEIAVRIIRACHELGIPTVAAHSTADTDALHVKLATESVCIGPPLARDSYLNITAIMSAAVATGVDAIHPGYGFLSENHAFAEICGSCGITFIGPTSRAMRTMGDKARARRIAEKAGVKTIPGESKGYLDPQKALLMAEKIGFPVLLKACAGGGGRGMKIVDGPDDFETIFMTASSEVEAAFGDGSLLVEKYLPKVRHVEVQIAGDRFHNFVHYGTRDCSIQRRYQKLIEESPAPGLSEDILNRIQESALLIAESVKYTGVGTVEFLVDVMENEFYFIEMNTRLQVEHPVTEMVTGTDLVKEQIRIAAGKELSLEQDDIQISGHAIEVRINAEDTVSMRPSPGKILGYHAPGGNGVRVDSAIYSEYTVQPYYDSLISKLIVWDRDRASCIRKMIVALDEYIIEGISTNIDLHRRILQNPMFVQGGVTTKFLEEVKPLDSTDNAFEGGVKPQA